MAKFCGKCGTKLDEATGLCPNCDSGKLKKSANQKHQKVNNISSSIYQSKSSKKIVKKQKRAKKIEEKRLAKREKKAGLSFGKKIRMFFFKLIIIAVIAIAITAGIVGTLAYFDVVDIQIFEEFFDKIGLKDIAYNEENQEEQNDFMIEPIDAEEYFDQNADVLSEIDVNNSKSVSTESEAIEILAQRGFGEYPVTTEYTMDGEYSDAIEVSESSSIKHPIYELNYVAENGDVWVVFLIDGDVMANPVSYNMQSTLGVQVIISESYAVTSYDSATNKFYKNIPDKSALVVKVVEKITVETLEKMTIGAIDEL